MLVLFHTLTVLILFTSILSLDLFSLTLIATRCMHGLHSVFCCFYARTLCTQCPHKQALTCFSIHSVLCCILTHTL